MSRRRKHQAHENHERWMVSYADFITLMFAFFVVMFASSQTDKARAKQVSESVTRALEEGRVSAAVAHMLRRTDTKAQIRKGPGQGPEKSGADSAAAADLLPSLEYLTAELKNEIAEGKLQLRLEPRGLIVSLTEAAFFPSGEDTIDKNTYGSVEKIAAAIKKLPNPVRLEGHTDSVPIHNSRFRNNWELSAARGIAMLELLKTRFGVDEKQLAMAGYADTCPLEANETETGRARNRRVDVVILTRAGYAAEPDKKSGK
ncbi:MAG: flagellar motor protein MotB [Acidobacteriota bacterium]